MGVSGAIEASKARLRPLKRMTGNIANRLGTPVRRLQYLEGRTGGLLSKGLTGRILELQDDSAVGSRRIELGGGAHPRQGFIHIDIDPSACHVEYFRPAWDLPVADGWASEISAIHTLEHIPPPLLIQTLREWHRVLARGGTVHVSVPNSSVLMHKFLTGSVHEKWLMSGALLGMYCGPGTAVPEGIQHRGDHQIVFDFELLDSVLQEVGFVRVTDKTTLRPDRHTVGWRSIVDHYSLVVEAKKE